MRRVWPVVLLLLLAGTSRAAAADGCTFDKTGSTWTLQSDCATDVSITVPDGVTFDGAHHTILALDPASAAFRGGIVVVTGGSASVVNTVLSALMLADVCQAGNERLRGIYFNGASGVIRGNTILNVNKGQSACQEGNAIEVRNPDLGGLPAKVDVADNTIEGFQKTGIVGSGNVDLTIRGNSIGPSAAQRLLVANGIQVGAGARALIEGNAIAGNSGLGDAAATAILLVETAAGTIVRGNVIFGNADVGIYVMASGVRVERNKLTDSGSDGPFDVGIGNYGDNNVFDQNTITGYSERYQNVSDAEGGVGTVARVE